MTLENIKRKHAYLSWLASGEFTSKDFDYTIPGRNEGEEAGTMKMGELPQPRINLIISDAKRHLANLERKFPQLKETPRPDKPTTKKEKGSKE